MSEQQTDFKKIIYALKSEKYTPQQIGSFMKQYYVKHLANVESRSDTITQDLDDVSAIFDGGLF
jgi:hypothetical protein